MRIYEKEHKESSRGSYYGTWGEISAGISVVTIGELDQNFEDVRHVHEEATEFYIVTQGRLLVEVGGRDVEVDPEHVLMVEPGEVHFVKSILTYPVTWVSTSFPKGSKSDKVLV